MAGDNITITADVKNAISKAVAEALAAQAGAATARTAENTEHSDRTRATTRDSADRSRSDWYAKSQVDSDVQVTEAFQKQLAAGEGRDRSWFDETMAQLHRQIEDLHNERVQLQAQVRRNLDDNWEHHRTIRSKAYDNIFGQRDELEVLALKVAEAVAPIIIREVKSEG